MGFLNIFGIKTKPKAPWEKYYRNNEMKFKVREGTIYDIIKERSSDCNDINAYIYYGNQVTYKEFFKQIENAAKAFRSQGIRQGDVVTICMPNAPESIISFYALNRIGAIVNMIHPLSSEQEIKSYLNSTKSVMLVMIDLCYEKVAEVIKETDVYKTVIVSAGNSMSLFLKLGYLVTKNQKIKKPHFKGEYIYWNDFLRQGSSYNGRIDYAGDKNTPAVILHSGGTTGIPKGILLSNGNFNALAEQVLMVMNRLSKGDVVLAIMPIFHGFGLGVSVHTVFNFGGTVNLVPQFDARFFDKLIMKSNPQVIVGVPTLYEALINTNNKKLNLASLKYAICGGDSLTTSLARKVNIFLENHNTSVKIMQGYGMTESTAAIALACDQFNVEGSVGIPFPGDYFKIVTPHTQEEVPYGETGEICVCGPTVMMEYLDNEKETNEALQIHRDGNVWLHTGDIGYMNKDGVIFYQSRLKRMIVSSGYNVYPQQIETVIEEHEAVLKCTVIGIPHPYKVQVAKAIIVLKNGFSDSWSVKKSIKEHCEKNLSKFSLPYEYEYRKSLPRTLIGKVDLKKLNENTSEGD